MDAAGKITTTLPPGEWVILRFGYTATGSTVHPASKEGQGSEADKLDAETVAFQFEKSLGRIIKDAGPLAGKSFKGILFDSFEAGFQNWTEHLPTDFSQQKGYDLIPFLPVLTGRIIQSQEVSEAVLWDFRQVIEELIAENYFGTMDRLAEPGFALGRYGTHFGRLNTWWPYADAWVSYVSRCQFLLQQGHTVADVAILVDEDTGYGFPSKMTDIVPGYDFQVCYPPDLRAMSWKDGRLVHPQGQSFGLLITPDQWVAQISTLQHLRKLVHSGAAVLGSPPAAPAGLKDVESRSTFDQLVSELWGEPDGKTNTARETGTAAPSWQPGEIPLGDGRHLVLEST